ncbi:MAG: glycerophosphodiester phosphodiesterase [Acidimicrobiales bacterium]
MPIGFAHRGARARAPENTLPAFRLALELGATGLESDVWLTSDGIAVLDHDGTVRAGLRGRRVADTPRAALPGHIPALADLYETCGTAYELSLDVKDDAAGPIALAVARDAGAEGQLWLCHHELDLVASWRPLSDTAHLVESTRLRRIKDGLERRAARHAALGIDAVNMHASDWTAGLVALWHRFDRLAFGWDAQQPRVLAKLIGIGIDAVYSDHVDRMMEALNLDPPVR